MLLPGTFQRGGTSISLATAAGKGRHDVPSEHRSPRAWRTGRGLGPRPWTRSPSATAGAPKSFLRRGPWADHRQQRRRPWCLAARCRGPTPSFQTPGADHSVGGAEHDPGDRRGAFQTWPSRRTSAAAPRIQASSPACRARARANVGHLGDHPAVRDGARHDGRLPHDPVGLLGIPDQRQAHQTARRRRRRSGGPDSMNGNAKRRAGGGERTSVRRFPTKLLKIFGLQ